MAIREKFEEANFVIRVVQESKADQESQLPTNFWAETSRQVINANHNGLSLFGGVDCSWKSANAIKPVIGATASPLRIDSTSGLALADLAFEANDAATGSSIAAFVTGADVTMKRVRCVAGKGAAGENGVLAPFPLPLAALLTGNDGKDVTVRRWTS